QHGDTIRTHWRIICCAKNALANVVARKGELRDPSSCGVLRSFQPTNPETQVYRAPVWGSLGRRPRRPEIVWIGWVFTGLVTAVAFHLVALNRLSSGSPLNSYWWDLVTARRNRRKSAIFGHVPFV